MHARCSTNSVPHQKYKNKTPLPHCYCTGGGDEGGDDDGDDDDGDSDQGEDEDGGRDEGEEKDEEDENGQTDENPALFQSSPEEFYGILLYHFVGDDTTESENNPQYHLTSRSSLHAATKTSRRLPGGESIFGEVGNGARMAATCRYGYPSLIHLQ